MKLCWNAPLTLMVVTHSATLCQLFLWLCLSAAAFLTEERPVARKRVNAVRPALDIRYCGASPIHTYAKQTAECATSLQSQSCCFVRISAAVTDISPDFNSNEGPITSFLDGQNMQSAFLNS